MQKVSIWACHDEWVESGQWRVTKAGTSLLVIGPDEQQDPHQHDRTISWYVLADMRLRLMSLSEVGDAWLVYPSPDEA
jgi:hypothetical protein